MSALRLGSGRFPGLLGLGFHEAVAGVLDGSGTCGFRTDWRRGVPCGCWIGLRKVRKIPENSEGFQGVLRNCCSIGLLGRVLEGWDECSGRVPRVAVGDSTWAYWVYVNVVRCSRGAPLKQNDRNLR